MEILKGAYEISIWDDVWDANLEKFVERKSYVIGSDTMESQIRVFDPILTEKTNGEKKLTFKLYKKYIDIITGEKVLNPYAEELFSERKVKLFSNGEWYDFLVKNVIEQTSDYLYTYELEDALVNELSKNGFNVVLNSELIDENGLANMGTAEELATKVLKETDWTVAKDSEAFVQLVEESLVYLKTGSNSIEATRILDQTDLGQGVKEELSSIIPPNSTVLAFYSSCTNKPYRFQFIYLPDGYPNSLQKDEHRRITVKNCQYYIDYPDAETNYQTESDGLYNFYLPIDWTVTQPTDKNEFGETDKSLSVWFRGNRFGFSQKIIYLPQLGQYVSLYNKNGQTYYGYQNATYCSPTLTQNFISNSALTSASGWTGTYKHEGGTTEYAKVENVFGYFKDGQFVQAVDELVGGLYSPNNKYEAYLKVAYPRLDSIVINSGPYDNRRTIYNMEPGDKWVINYLAYDATGKEIEPFIVSLGEYNYVTGGGYAKTEDNLIFNQFRKEDKKLVTNVLFSNYTPETFAKRSQVRVCFELASNQWVGQDIYIKVAELYKAVYTKQGKLITPEEQANTLEDRVIDKDYYYFLPEAVEKITSIDQLKPEERSKKPLNKTYKPIFNAGAQKVRAVEAKESNYFNILQSIAETFGAWLKLRVERDDFGAVTKKTVAFKNYLGKDNYAGFKYGVNLKDIQRTYASKELVTKLIVKQNSNELAKNGFCTISRAAANPTGENYIFDFSYYHNMGLLNAREFVDSTYSISGATGPDTIFGGETNIQGYFPRIKSLNERYFEKQEILLGLSSDLTHLKANMELEVAKRDAATYEEEEIRRDIYLLTKKHPDNPDDPIDKATAERSDVRKLLQEYVTCSQELKRAGLESDKLIAQVKILEKQVEDLKKESSALMEQKAALNQLFYSRYSRFIQEGTWISEEYVDDELYYADALSVAYNSCYPKVAYKINVLDVKRIEGFEDFVFNLGDKTNVEDREFFGEKGLEEVVVTEISNHLDSPDKVELTVQNFKNQFQDLFQRITATVQQAQYSSGAYEKAVALAEAKQERKYQFLSEALDAASARLTAAGQQSVVWGSDGITVTSVDSPSDCIRMVGGAILLSKQDKNGMQKWVTGVTSDGISANLITAGTINANEISIMDYNQPAFRWDAFGLTAFETTSYDGVLSGFNPNRFVRFDKNGIYGIDNKANGLAWTAKDLTEINNKATFALTWEGLKVVDEDGVGAIKIGRDGNNLIQITKKEEGVEVPKFSADRDGNVSLVGTISGSEMYASTIRCGEDFVVTADGILTSKKGLIGSWEIAKDGLRNKNGSIYLGTQGVSRKVAGKSVENLMLAVGDGDSTNFGVDTSGKIYAKDGYFKGTIDGSEITGSTINIGDGKFQVTLGGKLIAKGGAEITGYTTGEELGLAVDRLNSSISAKASKTSGQVTNGCGWSLTSDAFIVTSYNGGTAKDVLTIDKNGLAVNGSGAFSGDITGASGTIGGWKYDSDGITATAEAIYNSGILYRYRLTAKGIKDLYSSYEANWNTIVGVTKNFIGVNHTKHIITVQGDKAKYQLTIEDGLVKNVTEVE